MISAPANYTRVEFNEATARHEMCARPRSSRGRRVARDWFDIRRRGCAKAMVAVAHKILIFAFQMLSTNTPCQDLGDDCFDRINPQRVAQKLIRRLISLGL
jgi:hypothetical protein